MFAKVLSKKSKKTMLNCKINVIFKNFVFLSIYKKGKAY